MLKKDIFNSPKPLENLLNRTIFAYLSKGSNVGIPNDPESFIKNGYAGNVNIYPIIRRIVTPAIGVKWGIKDEAGEWIEGSELAPLLKNPNTRQSFNEFIDEMMCWRLITGNSFTWVLTPDTGSNKGKPAEIWPLPTSQTEIVSGGYFEPVQEYKLNIGDRSKRFPASQVVHGRYTNLSYDAAGGQLYGMSPLQAAIKVMTATNSGYDTMAKQFDNGGPDVIITGTKETATQEWTQEQFDTVWQRFKSKFRKGSKERFMLKNLPVEVHEIGKSLVDMNVLEYLKLSLRDYCNIYGIPSALMNDNQYATQSANAREFQRQLWNNAVIPELERCKDDMNKIAAMYTKATGKIETFDFDLTDIPELQADNSLMSQSLSTAWWLTPNQRLVMMGLPPVDGDPLMNTVFAPMGLVPLSDLNDPLPDAAKSNAYLKEHGITY